ncbi:hypothetical protein SprV_0200570400 [Sparganum proliferum]
MEADINYYVMENGRPKAERRDADVAISIRKDIVRRLPCLPQGINDPPMSLRLPLRGGQFATIVSVYATLMTRQDAGRNKLYKYMRALLVSVPKADKWIVLDELSVRVSIDRADWRGVLGPHRPEGSEDSNLLIMQTITLHQDRWPAQTTPPSAPISSSSTTTVNIIETVTGTADISCSHCPPTFTSHIGLVGQLRIQRTETGEPVRGAPAYTRRIRLNCPSSPRTFTNRIGLLGPLHIHDNLRWTTAGYTTSSHISSPTPGKHNNITHHKHPIATSRANGKCASRLLLYAAPLLPV